MTDVIRSFPPIVGADPRILILGSMPGEASLRAGEYYAHPRNLFWRIVGEAVGFDADAPYAERVATLAAAGVALWDVAAACVRPGSLDTSIVRDSVVANDIPGLLRAHPRIGRICFNGAAADALFCRYVDPVLSADTDLLRIERIRLPSTSPANASIPLDRKRAAWRGAVIVERQAVAEDAPQSPNFAVPIGS